jgi:pimeloyl-ACP methyl ester carboxylesterase
MSNITDKVARIILVFSMILAIFQLPAPAQGKECPVKYPTFYRTIQVDGLSIFYREAGRKDAPTLLLLHGLPSSSRMFEPLFSRLSDRYHLIAPDYPGFGHSDWPDPKTFAYTFDHIAETMNHFTKALGLSRYTLYMQDYGGPVGFRMALAHPDRIETLIVQDVVAHNEGLGTNWKTRRAFWADRAANESALRTNLLSLQTTRTRHVGGDANVQRYDPDLWTVAARLISERLEWLANSIRHTGEEDKGAARSRALMAYCALVGAIIMARAVSDQELSREILKTVVQLLKTSPRHHGR